MTVGGSLSGFIIQKAEKKLYIVGPHAQILKMLSILSFKSENKCEVDYWS